MRYVAVSAFNVVMHQVVLNLANSVWDWGGGVSNVFAAVVTTIPAYFLSRHWVWEVQGSHDLRRHVLPFWIIALVGLVLSTVMAEVADRSFGSGLPVAVASLAGYVVVWLAKFFILDRLFTGFGAAAGRCPVADTARPETGARI